MFPVILGRPGLVESTCPQTGEAIRIELTSRHRQIDRPRRRRRIRPQAHGQAVDVRSAICQPWHCFSSTAAATRWSDEHPDGEIHSVADGFRLDRQVVEQLGWAAR